MAEGNGGGGEVSTSIDLTKLHAAGFTAEIKPRRAAVVLSVEGLDKSGKTHFAFTAPGPICYISTDWGDEGVIQKFPNKQIIRPIAGDLKLDIPAALDRSDPTVIQPCFKKAVDRFVTEYRKAIELGVRTIILDKGSELWEWIRLAHYGRQSTNRNDYITTANAFYRDLVREANLAGINLIIINEVKALWESYNEDGKVKFRKTDKFESSGNEKDPQLVIARLRMTFVEPQMNLKGEIVQPGRFETQVRRCRDNFSAVGMTLTNADFALAMSVCVPEVEAWS
jgi:hypothetical protein